ncbi:hypothetical protein ZOSMA_241G00250 [Zostera marina]|uniref:Uncharacterized protein n=1 Tax=Zostera marina TaxID=29655 RepID=A0A0K9PGW8_ZOSMR|nr:hypothetical protein ZOSMA_241G00250 [Zostera marina]
MTSIGFSYAQIHTQQKACKEKAKMTVFVENHQKKKSEKTPSPLVPNSTEGQESLPPHLSSRKIKSGGGWFSF